jgi:hypothetical protein
MDQKDIMRIFEETAYVRTGGSPEELRAFTQKEGPLC